MIELKEVTMIYPGQKISAVDGLSLNINTGETCVLVGLSGCGKSTTIRMINGMIKPTSGSVCIDSKDIREFDPNKLRRGIGYVIQQIGLLPHRTVGENIAIVPTLLGWPADKIRKRIDELLELMGLDPEMTREKYPLQLSGGQMQRVGVARAMAADPPIMLMDEPYGAVDPMTRKNLQDEFLRLQTEIKKTVCFVTHDINEAIKMGDKIAIFDQGKIVQQGTPEELLTNPINDFVKDFIGSDRFVKKLHLTHVDQIIQPVKCMIHENELAHAYQKLADAGEKIGFLIDALGKPLGFVTLDSKDSLGQNLSAEHIKEIVSSNSNAFVQDTCHLQEALSLMLEFDTEFLGVLKGEELSGLISFKDISKYARKRGA